MTERCTLRSGWSVRWGASLARHVAIISFYGIIGALLTWPLVRDFTSLLISDGVDARHNLWGFWHLEQFLLGHQPLFDAPLLYYPRGISLLVHGVGPLSGLFALPFWPWGAAAAYNGALLVALTLSGYSAYLLGRDLGFGQGVAGFVGLMVIASPMVIAGLESHVTKVFVGAMALALLVALRALDPARHLGWAAAVGPAMLIVLLHNGYQFIFTTLAIAFFALMSLWRAPAPARLALLRRCLLMAASALLLAGPLLLAIVSASATPGIEVDVNADSREAPDLLQFLLPPTQSLLFGEQSAAAMEALGPSPAPPIESAVSLAVVGLALLGCAWWSGRSAARRWCLLTAGLVLLALGPSLRVAGQVRFTEYDLPLALPYAFLTGLPGLDFMRAPGRFMMLGFIAFAVSAGYGLAWLGERYPGRRRLLLVIATALLLLEVWPRPRHQEALGPVPAFYQQLGADPAVYGVLDLPTKPAAGQGWNWTSIYRSSFYQTLQMIHGKGIAGGYISRSYGVHPLFPELFAPRIGPLYIDGQLAVYAGLPAELARLNYRYVVLHKTIFGAAKGAEAGLRQAEDLIAVAFAGQRPIVDDDLVRVYQVDPHPGGVQIGWGTGWQPTEKGWRWASSPATLSISADREQPALLTITPAFIYDPAAAKKLGARGVLTLTGADGDTQRAEISAGQPASVPLSLRPGTQSLTLTLEAGSFTPTDREAPLSFAVERIELTSAGHFDQPPDLRGEGASRLQARFGAGRASEPGAGSPARL